MIRRDLRLIPGLIALLGLLGGLRPAHAADELTGQLSDDEQAQGFVSLFNGVDFAGWQFGGDYGLPDPLPDNWKVEDGVIKLSGGGRPHLGTQWDYEDFDMRFEWRAMRPKYNSGFFIRSGRKVGSNQLNLARGAEGRFFGGKMNGGPAVPDLQNPAGEWNAWRVLVQGDKVTFWCNGKLAWEGTEFQATRGHIGLQAEGAPLEFRNLRIRELGYEPLNSLEQWNQSGGSWSQQGDALTSSVAGASLSTKKSDHAEYTLRLEWKGDAETAAVLQLRGTAEDATVVLGRESPSAVAPGQWNYLQVDVSGQKARVWQNGTVIAEDAPVSASAGGVGMLLNQGTLSLRNIRIRPAK